MKNVKNFNEFLNENYVDDTSSFINKSLTSKNKKYYDDYISIMVKSKLTELDVKSIFFYTILVNNFEISTYMIKEMTSKFNYVKSFSSFEIGKNRWKLYYDFINNSKNEHLSESDVANMFKIAIKINNIEISTLFIQEILKNHSYIKTYSNFETEKNKWKVYYE